MTTCSRSSLWNQKHSLLLSAVALGGQLIVAVPVAAKEDRETRLLEYRFEDRTVQ